jgi:hypothetical protein
MGWNSIPGFSRASSPEMQDAMGITKFDTTDESLWAQIIGGLLIQGGLLSATGAAEFHAPYEKQVLGVFINGGIATGVSLTGFTSDAASYWWAIGV